MFGSETPKKLHPAKKYPQTGNKTLSTGLRIAVLFFFIIILPNMAAAADDSEMINCDIHHGSCMQTIQGTDIRLDISPKPVSAMTDLRFTVTFVGSRPASDPFIDLGMPGMNMGPNRVFLRSVGKDVYEGTGIIVRCPSGKKIWKATVTVPATGSVEFVFDVIY